eukprot:4229367-Amphidinium_carterae.1
MERDLSTRPRHPCTRQMYPNHSTSRCSKQTPPLPTEYFGVRQRQVLFECPLNEPIPRQQEQSKD